jgi:hypothetical protein
VGALKYFATLTEIPIMQGLIGAGMGKGPALALLLVGPALSLPDMLFIRSVTGTRKTMVFVSLVVMSIMFRPGLPQMLTDRKNGKGCGGRERCFCRARESHLYMITLAIT